MPSSAPSLSSEVDNRYRYRYRYRQSGKPLETHHLEKNITVIKRGELLESS